MSPGDMNNKDRQVIRNNYVELVKTLEAQNLLGYLYQEGVLSDDDKDDIDSLRTTKKQNEKLLDKLKHREDGLKMLIKALLMSEVQAFLGHKLLESVPWTQEDINRFKLELGDNIDERQMLVAVLKQENNQLKAKDAENQKKIRNLEEHVAALEQKSEQLSAKLEETVRIHKTKEETLTVLLDRLQRKNYRPKASGLAVDSTSLQKETSGKPEEELHHLRARRHAISFRVGGRAKYEEFLKEKGILTQDINGNSKEAQHQFPARRNALSFKKGGRAKYEEYFKEEKENLAQKINQLEGKNVERDKISLQEGLTRDTSKLGCHQLRARPNHLKRSWSCKV